MEQEINQTTDATRLIIGNFKAQIFWYDQAKTIWEKDFDATPYILDMPLEEIQEIDEDPGVKRTIAEDHNEYDGPFELIIDKQIRDFFNVGELSDVTQKMLDKKREEYNDLIIDPLTKTNFVEFNVKLNESDVENLSDEINKLLLNHKNAKLISRTRHPDSRPNMQDSNE